MSTSCEISVVVATYNRSDIISTTFRHLAAQTLDPSQYEVIVVDDGSTDDTEERIRTIQPDLPYKLTYLKHPNRGVSYTQNRGIKASSAPIVCLIADDIHLAPHALQAHLVDHERNPEPNMAILGKVIQSPKLTQSIFLKVWDPFRFSELENKREVSYLSFFACNISCKKDFLLRNGLFNETLVEHGAYAHEDVELGYRLAMKGLRILYNKNALGYHFHVVTLDKAMQTAYKKGLTWLEFRRLVDEPELTVRYHVLQPPFLKDYIRAFRQNNGLLGLDSKLIPLAIGQLGRIVLFNIITVPYFWLPIMKRAETNSLLAGCMHKLFYRCAISHHFHKGVAHALKGCTELELTNIRGEKRHREVEC